MNLKSEKENINLECVIICYKKTGYQRSMLPNDFSKWHLIYYYYSKWSDAEYFDFLRAQLREKIRLNQVQNRGPSLGIMDSQSVKWGNNRSLNGFDGNKKVIKRDVVVDKNGFLLSIMVTVANVYDSKAVELLMRAMSYFLSPVKVIFTDGGYRERA